jgi:hypothetical protein
MTPCNASILQAQLRTMLGRHDASLSTRHPAQLFAGKVPEFWDQPVQGEEDKKRQPGSSLGAGQSQFSRPGWHPPLPAVKSA